MTLEGSLLAGRYRVVRRLDAGGMGVVYEALQEGLGRRVALKAIHPHLAEDPNFALRFHREAHAVAALGHPNIVQVTDFHAAPGERAFFVMEFLEGQSLRDVIREEVKLSQTRAIGIAIQILSALEAAHGAGLVHRDIKPGNVFVVKLAEETELAKLLDFGVARVVEDGAPTSSVGGLVGTVAYMAPEALLGGAIDARADLFSLGATLYHAMSGVRPFEGKTPAELTHALLQCEARPLEELVFGIDPWLAAIVGKAMRREPDGRFASAAEMREALATVLGPRSQSLRKTVEVAAMVIPEEARAPASATEDTGAQPTSGRVTHPAVSAEPFLLATRKKADASTGTEEAPPTASDRSEDADARIVARVATLSAAQRTTRREALQAGLGLAKTPGIRSDIEKELAVLAEADVFAIDTVPMKSSGGAWIFVAVIVALVIGAVLFVRARSQPEGPRVPVPAAPSR